MIAMSNFENICKYAKEKNAKKLSEIVNSEVCIDVFNGIYTPVMFLAKSGEFEAVAFLIEQYNANKRDAIQGYAIGGFTNKVNEFLKDSEDMDDYDAVIRGYAVSGNFPTVKILIENSDNK